jgi:hypothetical protein
VLGVFFGCVTVVSPNADRENIALETLFSEVVAWLESYSPATSVRIENAVDALT